MTEIFFFLSRDLPEEGNAQFLAMDMYRMDVFLVIQMGKSVGRTVHKSLA